jgi:hypothetical protein
VGLRKGNGKDIPVLINEIKSRYREMGINVKLNADYLFSLNEKYDGKGLNIYRKYLDGELLARFITLEYKNNLKFWLGGTKKNNIPAGINEFFHW